MCLSEPLSQRRYNVEIDKIFYLSYHGLDSGENTQSDSLLRFPTKCCQSMMAAKIGIK